MGESISTYINPLTDFGFKYIFGREADKEFTVSFLNALSIAPKPVVDVTFVDKENKGEGKDDRAIYYLAADLYAQGQKGDDWGYKLTPVYGVFLMNFEWRDVREQHLREDVCLFNMQTKRVFSDRMRMTFLKIPMMDKEADDCETTLERWLYILKHMEKMEAIPHSFTKDPVFRNLNRVARYAALSDSDKVAYKKSLKAYRDAYAIAETERSIGKEEGIQIGEARGIQIGEARGIQIGEARGILKMAKRMKDRGSSIEEIAKLTELSIEEIDRL